MERLLYANLATNELSEQLTNTAFRWPTLTQSETLALSLRFAVPNGTAATEAFRTVTHVRAAIGRLDGTAEAGQWGIKLGEEAEVEGDNTLAPVDFDVSAADLQTALNALTDIGDFGTASVAVKDGSWEIIFAGASEAVPISVTHNSLEPFCRVRIRTYELDGNWVHEIRLVEQKAAFTSLVDYYQVAAPVIANFETGIDPSVDGVGRNAIQKITFSPGFRGLYKIQRGLLKTDYLDENDGPAQLQEALEAKLADDGGTFPVSRPTTNVGHIEFAGTMGAQPQDLLTVVDVVAPQPDLKILLDLDNPVCRQIMRDADLKENRLKLPIEIEVKYEDPDDDSVTLTWIYQSEVEIRRELIYEGEAEVDDTNWIRPIDPRGHVPFDPAQVAVGQQFYAFSIGDGTKTVWDIDHSLGMAATGLILWEDETGGAFLVQGTDYAYTLDPDSDGTNSLRITLLGDYASTPPATDALAGTVIGYAVASQFDPHGHTIAQIDGLSAALTAIGTRLAVIESQLFTNFYRGNSSDSAVYSRQHPIPAFGAIFPLLGRSAVTFVPGTRIGEIELATLPRFTPPLYGAVHDTTVDDLPTTGTGSALAPAVPVPANKGGAYENVTEFPLFLSVGQGYELQPGEFAATDGEVWYPVEQYGSTSGTSYYPAHQVVELFEETVEAEELIAGRQYRLQFATGLAVLRANAPVYCHLVIEIANLTEDATPGTPGPNLKADDWEADPVLDQRLTLTGTPVEPVFGYQVTRAADGTLTADKYLYGKWISTTAPDSARFAIRARLVRWDTPAKPEHVTGFIAYSGPTFESGPVSEMGDEIGFSIVD